MTTLFLAGVATVGLGAEDAFAQTAVIHTTDDVNLRAAPTSTSARVGGIANGTALTTIDCAASGQAVNGINVWMHLTINGASGYYASAYDDSTYSSWQDLYNRYGIPQCGSNPTPVSSAAQSAVNWASARVGQSTYAGRCLTFVFYSYCQAGVNLRSQVNVNIGADTYPLDIWNHFSAGQTGGGTPPAGALVFYAAKNGDRTLSHVTLSVGGGNTISTSDSIAASIHYETIAQHNYANYLGWWLPQS